MREETHVGTCIVLASREGRLRGLLGTSEDAAGVLLLGCRSVHTFGMRYALDIALVNARHVVVEAQRGVSPGKVVRSKDAVMVLERPACSEQWVQAGDELSFDWVGGKKDGSYVEVWIVGEGEGYRFRRWRQGDPGRFIPAC